MIRYSTLVLILLCAFLAKGIAQTPPKPEKDTLKPSPRPVLEPVAIPQNELLRQTDAVWSRRVWRVIDLREKMNHFFYYPPQPINSCKSLITILINAIVDGKIAVYDPLYDDFRMKLSLQEVKAIWTETRKRTYEKPYPPYEQFDSVSTHSFNPQTIKKFKIKEEWFYNKYKGFMEVRILGMCPVKENIDAITGEFNGYSDMFWVYFPEFDIVLAQEKIIKPFSVDTLTVDTYKKIFSVRYFSSYIYKEDNAYDRQIQDYTKYGLDNLIEADKVKENIRITESDLWDDGF